MNHTEDFNTRNSADPAEDKCKEYLDAKGITWTQFGFDCRHTVSGKDFYKVDWRLKCQPDFMVFQKQPVLLECKGFRDELRLKVYDIKAYDGGLNSIHYLASYTIHQQMNILLLLINY